MIQKPQRAWIAATCAAVLVGTLAACSSGSSEIAKEGLEEVPAEVKAAAEEFEGPFSYWIGLTFPEESNTLEEERIRAWADAVGVEVDILQINQGETVQQVNGALESGTLPTALTVSYDLLQTLGADGKLTAVPETYAQIGEDHGGWLPSIDAATQAPSFANGIYGVPFGFYGNVLFRRDDLLSAAGFDAPPATWEEMGEQGAKAAGQGEYALGFSLSNTLDGNLTTSMMQSWGGRVADAEGVTCTIASDETADFLEWIKGAWEGGLFPPSAVTWDGAGDNNSYLSGESLFIANTGSVYLGMEADDPELSEATAYSPLPAGPVEQVSPVDPRYRVIPTTTSDAGAILAQDLFKSLADDEYMAEYMANTTYGPVLRSQLDYPIYSESPVHEGLLELAEKGTPPAYPDTANTAYSDYQNSYSSVRMVQRVVIDGVSIDQAMAEAQTACQAIYDSRNG
jgi:multiple sugar transport system substrate-binding protein